MGETLDLVDDNRFTLTLRSTSEAVRQTLSLTGRLRKWWRRLISMLRARMFAAD